MSARIEAKSCEFARERVAASLPKPHPHAYPQSMDQLSRK